MYRVSGEIQIYLLMVYVHYFDYNSSLQFRTIPKYDMIVTID